MPLVREEWVDPRNVRFTHSNISPKFSCGRDVHGTLQEIVDGRLKVAQLPKVLVVKQDDTTYFSQNNRRLWVLKQCRERGFLKENGDRVLVRVQLLTDLNQSRRNQDRWSVERCASQCTFMTEKQLRQRYGKAYIEKKSVEAAERKDKEHGYKSDEGAVAAVSVSPQPQHELGSMPAATVETGGDDDDDDRDRDDEVEGEAVDDDKAESAPIRLTGSRGGGFAALLDTSSSDDDD
jgi:hypothetical protein